jgi:multiple sugar transport system substrate-binding protein
VNAGRRVADLGVPLRRRQVLGLLAGGLVSTAAGCSWLDGDGASFEGVGPIRFAAPPDFSRGGQRSFAVRRWNDDHPNEQASSEDLPPAADLQRAHLIARLQAGHAGYDVLGLDVVWTAEFAKGPFIDALDEAKDLQLSLFLQSALESARFDDQLWGVPLFSNAGLLYYRSDLVEQVPSSWAELAEQAEELSAEHRIAGYVGQLARYEGLTVNLLEAIWGHGGDLLLQRSARSSDTPRLDVDATISGLSFLRGGIDKGWIPRAALRFDEERSRLAFQGRGAVFMRNWPYAYDLLDADDSPVRGDFAVAKLPGPSALGGANLAIATSSQNEETALAFIRYLTDQERQRMIFEDGGYPAVLASVYEDPNVQRQQPYTLALRDSIKDARSRPSTPYYGQVTRVIQDAASAVLEGQAPDSAAKGLADRLPEALEGQ